MRSATPSCESAWKPSQYSHAAVLLQMIDRDAFCGNTRINIHDDSDLVRWANQLSVTPAQLFAAVCAVGSSARLVIQYLGSLSA